MADSVVAFGGQGNAEVARHCAQKLIRHLDQDASAVARFRVGANGTAVLQIAQDVETVLDDLVALLVLDIGDEANAAGIFFVARVIQTLRCGVTCRTELTFGGLRHAAKPLKLRGGAARVAGRPPENPNQTDAFHRPASPPACPNLGRKVRTTIRRHRINPSPALAPR